MQRILAMQVKLVLVPLLFVSVASGQNSLQLGSIEPSGAKNDYAIGTAVFSAANAAITTINITKLRGHDTRRHNAIFGMLIGAAQTGYGLINKDSHYNNADMFSAINVGVGLLTIATGGLRLLSKPETSHNRVSFRVTPIPPSETGTAGLAFYVRARL